MILRDLISRDLISRGLISRGLISKDGRRIFLLAALLFFAPLAFLAPLADAQEKDKSANANKEKEKEKDKARDGLADYVRKVSVNAPAAAPGTLGSLWTDNGRLANMVADYKASRVGDLVTINIAQNLSASSGGNVATNRAFSASSGINALPGQLKTAGIASLFSPTSAQALTGKGQATSQTSLSTTLTGRVAAVLPSGTLVVEAEREINMNQEHETVILRGLVRPGDLDATNTVLSNSVGDLEIEVKSKGVISESTRAPNPVLKWILRILNF